MTTLLIVVIVLVGTVTAITIYDLFQRKHAILRNFPVIGHLRYGLEAIGPELRQYIVTDNDDERPFTRDQRRWVYSTAKEENPYFGFGTDNQFEIPDYLIIRHSTFPRRPVEHHDGHHLLPCVKVLGEWRNRAQAFRPSSVVNVSAMSFGSLSGAAIEALNRGCAQAGALHNTGEGGVSVHHRAGHGDLVWQIGTGYFGCRTSDGSFDLEKFGVTAELDQIKAIEIKLSQGAKPGLGGVLPGAKVTAEIAEARGVTRGKTVVSPNSHDTFSDVAGLIDWVEELAAVSGKPVGIKSAIGDTGFWNALADEMAATDRGPDFITVDGGEGGTGAAPLVFSDHVALPFRLAFAEVYRRFAARGLHEKVVFVGSGKLGFPAEALAAMNLGADLINVGREAMLAVGCIQAQHCHTGHCPTGVATQNRWLSRGLDPTDKGVRAANYLDALRGDLLKLSWACGVAHPGLAPATAIDLLETPDTTVNLLERYGYDPSWRVATPDQMTAIEALMSHP
ncbi:MAG: FMN-binding glutamate synthase family protein [Actinomycetia bacterium]|nr:FMN-binding glutamate synthase family protein [Actinomycetes bacterium]MCP4085670.1 FMN-binding glutamate synthase family protein [Actinomycetes bacterium]